MIDFYDIELSFIRQGPQLWRRLPGHMKPEPPVNRQQVRVRLPHRMGEQRALMLPGAVRLQVCPQKVLGRWNTYGSSDLRAVVLQTAPLVLRAMGVPENAEILEHLRAGDYKVREVHVAHQFWLPGHRCISDFLKRLERTLNESHRPQGIHPGQGFRLNARSRTASWLFYDKLLEIQDRALRRYAKRFRLAEPQSFARAAIVGDREFQRLVASCGPRAELRLGDHFFRRQRDLALGAGWGPGTADTVYRQYLKALNLPRQVDATYSRRLAQGCLSLQVFRTYLLWAHGEPVQALAGTVQTFQTHRREIAEEVGLDIAVPASAVLRRRGTVDAARVFRWDNRVLAQQLAADM